MASGHTHDLADPQAGGECPHCSTWHPYDPAACEVSDARVRMAADYVARHPGCGHIDAGLAVSADTPGSMAKGYRAVNEALARGLIGERRTAAGPRLYVPPDPGDPYPLVPGGEHPVIPRTGTEGQGLTCDGSVPVYHGDVFGTCRWPLTARCACGEAAAQAAAWLEWHHHPAGWCGLCQAVHSDGARALDRAGLP